ncbi:MAG: 2-amino-4-hydroxy-6-hydroxymethyldihydropteridine diphosphokinase [Reyranellaceae bacterium]
MGRRQPQRLVWCSLGANERGCWGEPPATLRRAIDQIERAGLRVVACSSLYLTEPLGGPRQPRYSNAVIGIEGSIAPAALLRLLKRLERHAGRRPNGHWSARPLDIDILDFKGARVGRSAGPRKRSGLVLPHPEMTARGFVLVPLAEVAPRWRHPIRGIRAADFLRRAPRLCRGVRLAAPLRMQKK